MVAPVELGTLLFTAIEPHRGRQVAYNRWYENDHFYAGCMVGPYTMAGSRFVATRRLKDLRSPVDSPMCADPLGASYLSVYWIQKGFHDKWTRWAVDTVSGLHAEGRMFADRDHSHTGMYRHHSSVRRSESTTSIELALDRHLAGLVVTAGELGNDVGLDGLATWTEHEWCRPAFGQPWGPEVVGTSSLLPLPDGAPGVPTQSTDDRRFLQLHFVDHDPSQDWAGGYGRWGERFEAAGLGTHVWTAPFLATVHGTDTYTDELW